MVVNVEDFKSLLADGNTEEIMRRLPDLIEGYEELDSNCMSAFHALKPFAFVGNKVPNGLVNDIARLHAEPIGDRASQITVGAFRRAEYAFDSICSTPWR